MRSTYELRRFRSQNKGDLIVALKLYADNIEPSYRTDTNEILYWIDKFDKKFDDSFFVLGLYLNNGLIGYLQMAYFKEERFIEVDYIVIDKAYRKNSCFFEFIDLVAVFIAKENLIYDYIICEVGCYFEDNTPTESSKTLMRLLKMSHFGVIKCAYYVPRLGKRNYESQMRAVLMIYAKEELKQLRKETYMMVIGALYFKYYQRWYYPFFTTQENEEYAQNLNELFEKIATDVERRKNIEINGYQNLLPLNITDYTTVRARKGIQVLSFLFIFVTTLISLGALALYIKKRYDLDLDKQSSILILAVLSSSILMSVLFGKRDGLATRIVEKLVDKL